MGMVWEVMITALCAVGLALCGWWLLGRLLRPLPKAAVWAVIPGWNDGDGLEHTVRALVWLRSMGLLNCPIVIADMNLTPAGRELAARLALRWPCVSVRSAEKLP